MVPAGFFRVSLPDKAIFIKILITNPTSTFPPQNFPVIQHLQFLHIYCGYYKFSNSTELG